MYVIKGVFLLSIDFAAKKIQSRDEKNSWKESLQLFCSWLRITAKTCYLIKEVVNLF